MGNLFDGIQDSIFKTVNRVFGYNCLWIPSDNSEPKQANILYNDPTKSNKRINDVIYDPQCFMMEYKKGDLPGLYDSIRAGGYEKVTIWSIGEDVSTGTMYNVKSFDAKFDGKTYLAFIEKI